MAAGQIAGVVELPHLFRLPGIRHSRGPVLLLENRRLLSMPEPGTLALSVAGAALLGMYCRRR
jgi:hypothetical protein